MPYDRFVRPINPATEEPLEEVPDHAPAEVEAKLRGAADAFAPWRRTPMAERSRVMRRAASIFRQRSPDLSALMTREMGKPIVAAEAEVEKCAAACDHFADHAAQYLATETVPTDDDAFGSAIGVADMSGDGLADLVIGVPGAATGPGGQIQVWKQVAGPAFASD